MNIGLLSVSMNVYSRKRIGTKVTRHGVAIVKQFEMNGIFCTARSLSISRARNKTRTLQLMV